MTQRTILQLLLLNRLKQQFMPAHLTLIVRLRKYRPPTRHTYRQITPTKFTKSIKLSQDIIALRRKTLKRLTLQTLPHLLLMTR